MLKHIWTTDQIKIHFHKLAALRLVDDATYVNVKPGDPIYVFEYTSYKKKLFKRRKPMTFIGGLTGTPFMFKGTCFQHEYKQIDMCAEEIKNILELLFFEIKDSDKKLEFYRTLLEKHIQNIKIFT
jgi:hypothetical protein